jgi:hypothetical protein
LEHPLLAMPTNFEKRGYLERLLECYYYQRNVNLSNIKWIRDEETEKRRLQSEKVTKKKYGQDAWSFVRLVRNSIKHYRDLQRNGIVSN